MADFNWVDGIIIAILIFSVLAGFARGIVKELLSVLTWVIAFIVSSLFASKLAGAFTGSTPTIQSVSDASNAVTTQPMSLLALGLSFVSIFLAVLVVGSLISYVISGAVDTAGLGFVNRLFGGVFGLARGILINLVFIFIVQLTSYGQESYWKESKLVPSFQPAVAWLESMVSPNFEELKKKMTQGLENTAQSLINDVYQYRG